MKKTVIAIAIALIALPTIGIATASDAHAHYKGGKAHFHQVKKHNKITQVNRAPKAAKLSRFRGRPVYRVPHYKRYIGKPYAYRRGWYRWGHTWAAYALTAIGGAIIVNALGDLETENGQEVIVLGGGGDVQQVFTENGKVYLITE